VTRAEHIIWTVIDAISTVVIVGSILIVLADINLLMGDAQ
jgi:hypothetical protein